MVRQLPEVRLASSPSDIALAAGRGGSPKAIYKAITRLMRDPNPDVRVIAAQALFGNPLATADQVKNWLLDEPCGEARGWLYLALATTPDHSGFDEVRKKHSREMDAEEFLYLEAALAISRSSRVHLLELMKNILREDVGLSKTASDLCRMLVSEKAETELEFIRILERERYGQDREADQNS